MKFRLRCQALICCLAAAQPVLGVARTGGSRCPRGEPGAGCPRYAVREGPGFGQEGRGVLLHKDLGVGGLRSRVQQGLKPIRQQRGATSWGGVPSAVAASNRASCSWARAGPGYLSCHPITVGRLPATSGRGASQRRKLLRPRGEELPQQRQRRPGGESSSSPGSLGLRCRRDRIVGGGPEPVE